MRPEDQSASVTTIHHLDRRVTGSNPERAVCFSRPQSRGNSRTMRRAHSDACRAHELIKLWQFELYRFVNHLYV